MRKGKILKVERRKKRIREKRRIANEVIAEELKRGWALPVEFEKITSVSPLATVPAYYRDKDFICIDCDKHQVWTAEMQKWWHEEAGGEIEKTAVRCRECRQNERERKAIAREVHLSGVKAKNDS